MGAMIDGDAGARGPEPVVVNLPTVGTFRSDQPIAGPLPAPPNPPEWLEGQVGGNHYRKLRIQPLTYILANKLGFPEGNIVKLITRFRDKGGVEDLDKLIHYAQALREDYVNELREQSGE